MSANPWSLRLRLQYNAHLLQQILAHAPFRGDDLLRLDLLWGTIRLQVQAVITEEGVVAEELGRQDHAGE